jgi:hypothetical protein
MGTVIATRSKMRAPLTRSRRAARPGALRGSPPATRNRRICPRQPYHDAAEKGQSQEDGMPATLVRACPLCGLRFSNLPLLELHIREDHHRRERRPARDDDNPADTSDSAGKAGDS